jgi:cystathionine beta-lyase
MASAYHMGGPDDPVHYPRYFNLPNQAAAAAKIAALENGPEALVVSSGLAAISTVVLGLLEAGDHVLVQSDLYGGTHHLVRTELTRLGFEVDWAPAGGAQGFEAALTPQTRLVLLESPTNPLLKVVDLAEVADMARRRGAITVMDNTFATPINQKPLDLGIDVVIHSATKYLGGHSDLCAGAIVAGRPIMDRIREAAVNYGGVLGAFECYLLERSLKTLALRVRQHNENALALAEFLAGRPEVRRAHYPGLPGHSGHDIAAKQMAGFGGMLAVELAGSQKDAQQIVDRLELFTPAVSLGGVESLLCFPSLTSHAKMTPEQRAEMGVGDTLIRVSVGVEDPEDLIADWRRALG